MSGGGKRIADKSIKTPQDKVRTITQRNRGVKLSTVIKELNKVLIGWVNYFKLANTWLTVFRELGWMDTQETKMLQTKTMWTKIYDSKVVEKLRL